MYPFMIRVMIDNTRLLPSTASISGCLSGLHSTAWAHIDRALGS
jgi:hypothetical protein